MKNHLLLVLVSFMMTIDKKHKSRVNAGLSFSAGMQGHKYTATKMV